MQSQANKAAIISGIGTGVQAANVATKPEVISAAKGAYNSIFGTPGPTAAEITKAAGESYFPTTAAADIQTAGSGAGVSMYAPAEMVDWGAEASMYAPSEFAAEGTGVMGEGMGMAGSGVGSTIGTAVPWIGAAMLARDLVGEGWKEATGDDIGGWQEDVGNSIDVFSNVFDSQGNLLGAGLWGGMGGMLGMEKPFQEMGNEITDTIGEGASAIIDPVGALVTGGGDAWEAGSRVIGDMGDVVADAWNTVTEPVSGGKVICTELNRQGLLSDDVYRVDCQWGDTLSHECLEGYRSWARTVVRWMQASRVVTWMAWQVVKPIMREVMRVMGKSPHGSYVGRTLIHVGIPICTWIGNSEDCGGEVWQG
jgi:hypothetical protein